MKKRSLRCGGRILYIPVELLRSHPLKSRIYFNNEEIVDLCASICEVGILKPLTVFATGNGSYTIISGERRFRAAKLAELDEIPCILIKSSDTEAAFISLTENLQQSSLNYFELPMAVERIHQSYALSYTEIADRLCISLNSLNEQLKLLSIPDKMRISMIESGITERHARELIKLNDSDKSVICNEIIEKKLNVSQTRQRVKEILFLRQTTNQHTVTFFKDITVFINTIDNTLDRMVKSGINAEISKSEQGDFIEYKVSIPK